jgi:DNA-directed RNA polymerase specialized sigma24 family protein
MSSESGKAFDWVLTGPAFEMLVSRLEAAGTDYLSLRERIQKLFLCNRVRESEIDNLIDTVMDRAARRIDEGIEVRNPVTYISQIARYVLMEYWDSPKSKTEAIDDEASLPNDAADSSLQDQADKGQLELRLECLENCASDLPQSERQRVIDYYHDEKRAKIDRRKKMADELAVSLNNLRVRMHRTREKLEKCIIECVKKAEAQTK